MEALTLKHLRYFEALARHGHFGRAADVCAISQPALSVQIKQLETILGSVLFERSPRHVRLTAFGEAFAPRARATLQSVEDLADLARGAQDGFSGRLRLGIIPTIAPYLLPRMIGDLTSAHPGLDIHIRETVTPRLIAEVTEGHLDAAIVALPLSEPGLTEIALFTEALVLIRPEGDANDPVPTPAALRDMRVLLLEEGHCFRDQALSFCGIRSAGPRAGLDGTSLSTLVQMVGAGIGVTLVPEMAVAVETRSAAVSVARFHPVEPTRTVGMIWRRSNPLAPHLMQIAGIVQRTGTRSEAGHVTA